MNNFTNTTFDKIRIGQSEAVSRTLTRSDIEALAFVSGDLDPYQVGADAGPEVGTSTDAVAAEAFVSYILNRRFPGPGTRILAVDLKFRGMLRIGDTIAAKLSVRDKKADGSIVVFDCKCTNQSGEDVAWGTATASAPTEAIAYNELATPEIVFRRTDVFARLIRSCEGLPPVKCAVVHPCDHDSLMGPLEAAKRKLIEPVLVGPEARIRAVAAEHKADLSGCRIISTEHSEEAAARAVAMARAGEVQALMKGSLHTDELMGAVVPSANGLRTGRRISHAFILDVPTYPRMLIVTDAAINIAPNLKAKVDIVQNAIDLARTLGVACPKVAILSAVETVNPDIPSTIDAAALCKMADRKQIVGGILDGPLAFDNAISAVAAKIKKIDSPVAGEADILLAPDLEAANMIAKQLQYLAGADSAGIVLGTRVPIVLTSRADTVRTRLASTAVMALVAHARNKSGGKADAHQEANMSDAIGVLNAGSSSIKYSLFLANADEMKLHLRGQIEGLFTSPRFVAKDADGKVVGERAWGEGTRLGHDGGIEHLFDFLRKEAAQHRLVGVGHRVAHGGMQFTRPVRVDAGVIQALERLIPLVPLHQPHNLAPIRALMQRAPQLVQVACFDTSFHHSNPPVSKLFALPLEYAEAGIRRYGFHGLSYEYIASALPKFEARAASGRTIVLHLGSGSSMCAVKAGQSVASTMGLTGVDGLPMGTRSGSLDAGVLLFLMDQRKMDARAIEKLIYQESGLLGVSGISSDMRVLLASDEPRAKLAVDLFVYRIGRELGSLVAALGGVDAVVFTGGIGEHAAPIRARVCRDAAWTGLQFDDAANTAGGPRVSAAGSAVSAWVIPTNEELVIARHTQRAVLNS